ncbi:hypothetical protein C8Q73DRAFT_170603 [Cubamyces lactineus]|nr:hypothetical protein C8Q73DRAFT_170603 [Cubamyces lactineus]
MVGAGWWRVTLPWAGTFCGLFFRLSWAFVVVGNRHSVSSWNITIFLFDFVGIGSRQQMSLEPGSALDVDAGASAFLEPCPFWGNAPIPVLFMLAKRRASSPSRPSRMRRSLCGGQWGMGCLALGREDDGPSHNQRARATVKEGRTAGRCECLSDQIHLGDGRASSVVRARESRRHAHVGGLVWGVRANGARWADRVDVGEMCVGQRRRRGEPWAWRWGSGILESDVGAGEGRRVGIWKSVLEFVSGTWGRVG